jgi:ABC-2 type transport system ATP-binding protein
VSETASALRVTGLRHAYRDREVLRGVDLDVRRGETFGLLGPNGSGKSTALAVLAGLLPRQAGSVAWEGRELGASDRAFRGAISVVFQRPSLDPKLTVRQNLALAGLLNGLRRRVAARRADALLESAGLLPRANDFVDELSGGLKRRLDLARALMTEPRLLFMDEPTAGLDEASFRDTWARLATLREGRELSVIVATHRPEEAERCDRLAVLSEGCVAIIDSPQALQERVAKDIVVLRASDALALAADVRSRFDLACLVDGADVLVEVDRGHELIPRLVEGLPGHRLESVSLRRPTLADVFLKLTGTTLAGDLRRGSAA